MISLKPNILILILLILNVGCSNQSNDENNELPPNEELTSEQPIIPGGLDLDLDDDENIDYIIEYRHWHVDPIDPSLEGNDLYSGQISALGMNQILSRRSEAPLFLEDLNMIASSVDEPLYWSRHLATRSFITIQNTPDRLWPLTWNIASDSNRDTYFFGLKINMDSVEVLGWVELALDIDNGSVMIVNKGVIE